ncbi:MAG: hypothetical protein GY847_06600 [Proteobacteria bacterium]|nr:hypothetical protein [Pseudomonadota bacterium]
MGTATSYEMRYAPWSITEENFHLATEVPDMPVPEPSGTGQQVVVEDLESETLYRFAMVVRDEHEKTSYLSNVVLVQTLPEPDYTAPDAVSDLQAVELTEGEQTVPGDATSWSSQQSPEFVAGAIIDGDIETLWSTVARDASQTEWVDIDLGKVEAVTQLRIWPHDSYVDLFPPSFEVQVSADGLNWNTVFSKTDHVAEQGVAVEGTFPVVPVRYVKFLAKELSPNTNGYYYAVVSELELITPPTESGTVVVSWTATGDDADQGQASNYDLRIGSCPYSYEDATSIATMEPQVAGSQENIRITGLGAGIYCLGLIVSDEAENESNLSNIAEVEVSSGGGDPDAGADGGY